ncbi:PREDICTED: putative F-box protein At4g38870 [Camelina sativa]|uniref:F-box protein At4g38870 n=1 Tax=Camelina sativa TaxID=90675 RepID=A0ABM1QKH2_CAMSA|nr:PREDICTED: putative F-box protein At4g38870 [Camelina sativa]
MKWLAFLPSQQKAKVAAGSISHRLRLSTMETQRKKLAKVSVNSLPDDLMVEILKRFPVKTLIRFLSVSKLWSSIIRSPYFMKLFVNESLKRPKSLVFVFKVSSFSLTSASVHFKSTREVLSSSSSFASPATYHVTCHTRQRTTIAPSVHGLICYGPPSSLVIYNPCTRRSVTLPSVSAGKRATNQYLGYDPIDSVYKVLCIVRRMPMLRNRRGLAGEIMVLTLESSGSSAWRMFQGTIPPHSPLSEQLCINGVLYYQAFTGTKLNECAIMSFDVRSEKIDLIKGPCSNFRSFSKLTTYEGKLAVIFFEKKISGIIGLWVLEDASKEDWSKKTFALPKLVASKTNPISDRFYEFRTTDADTGEIIFTPTLLHSSVPSVLYYDLKKDSMRTFEVEGRRTEQYIRCHSDSVSSAQVENLMFL